MIAPLVAHLALLAAACAPAHVPLAAQRVAGLCRTLGETPSGTRDAYDRFDPWLATGLGGVLLELRGSASVAALAPELRVVGAEAVACPGGTQALWLPGTKDPDRAGALLAQLAAAQGGSLELVRWLWFGPTEAFARLQAACRAPERCEAAVRRLSRDDRCVLVTAIMASGGGPEDAFERCLALPERDLACIAPALAADRAARARCADAVLAGRP